VQNMTEWIWTKETWSKAQKGIELDTESWASANKNMLSFHLLSTRGCKGRPQHPKTLQQRALATGCHWMPRAHKTCNTWCGKCPRRSPAQRPASAFLHLTKGKHQMMSDERLSMSNLA
jgi:hypothetical protein